MDNYNDIEQLFVHEVYNDIAEDFDDTRYCVWNFVKAFLLNKDHLYGIDIGCGNGKNMLHDNMVGIDMCDKLLNISSTKNKSVIRASCCSLPFQSNVFDYAMSISVFHHLGSADRRLLGIHEMIRVVKPKGHCVFNMWSVENQDRRSFTPGDNFVSWHRKKGTKRVLNRFYHIYDYKMIQELIDTIEGVYDVELKNERGNWVVNMKKK